MVHNYCFSPKNFAKRLLEVLFWNGINESSQTSSDVTIGKHDIIRSKKRDNQDYT